MSVLWNILKAFKARKLSCRIIQTQLPPCKVFPCQLYPQLSPMFGLARVSNEVPAVVELRVVTASKDYHSEYRIYPEIWVLSPYIHVTISSVSDCGC